MSHLLSDQKSPRSHPSYEGNRLPSGTSLGPFSEGGPGTLKTRLVPLFAAALPVGCTGAAIPSANLSGLYPSAVSSSFREARESQGSCAPSPPRQIPRPFATLQTSPTTAQTLQSATSYISLVSCVPRRMFRHSNRACRCGTSLLAWCRPVDA